MRKLLVGFILLLVVSPVMAQNDPGDEFLSLFKWREIGACLLHSLTVHTDGYLTLYLEGYVTAESTLDLTGRQSTENVTSYGLPAVTHYRCLSDATWSAISDALNAQAYADFANDPAGLVASLQVAYEGQGVNEGNAVIFRINQLIRALADLGRFGSNGFYTGFTEYANELS